MVERSLLTFSSSLHDVHPRLVPGIGRYRATTHLIRRRARLHRSLGMPAKFACSLVTCSRTCMQMYEQKEEALACRRAAQSMVTRSLLFIVRLWCSPENGTRNILVQNNHASHSYTNTTVASIIGDASQVCFPRSFFFLASTPDGGVRVGT